jgi:hypothetical protein
VANAVLRGNRLTARIGCQDLNPILWHINMAQDQGQHPLGRWNQSPGSAGGQ